MPALRGLVCLVVAVAAAGAAEFQFGLAAVRITPTAETGGVREVLDEPRAKAALSGTPP